MATLSARTYLIVVLLVTVLGNFFLLRDLALQQRDTYDEHHHVHAGVKTATSFDVSALSSQLEVSVSVDGNKVYTAKHSPGDEHGRGMHVVVLSRATGRVMSKSIFDTYLPGAAVRLADHLNGIRDSRIVVIAVRDEASFSLDTSAKAALRRLGSIQVDSLHWRDMWCLIAVTGTNMMKEAITRSPALDSWGAPVHVNLQVDSDEGFPSQCSWPPERASFCEKYDGYGDLCDCKTPWKPPLPTTSPLLPDVPVAIMASQNRPKYLSRALRGLLSAEGVAPEMITVYVDGIDDPEAVYVARTMGITAIAQEPHGIKNARISQHYKDALTAAFSDHPQAGHVLVLEEDLDVSPDFFFYFKQTIPLLDTDPTLYCVSAWNDHGYSHSSADPTLLYRVGTMPGLGWVLKKSVFDELLPKWPTPDLLWDWDMWMRMPDQRKGRECIIPDVSRTFHFGASGLNVNDYFQHAYFDRRTINKHAHVMLQLQDMDAAGYDTALEQRIQSNSNVLDHRLDPCKESTVPKESSKLQLLFIEMQRADDWETWMALAKCWKIWDLDMRGNHKNSWRLWRNQSQLMVIGRHSPFFKFKPVRIRPCGTFV